MLCCMSNFRESASMAEADMFPTMSSALKMAPAVQGPCMAAGGAHPAADEVGVPGLVTPSPAAYGADLQDLEVSLWQLHACRCLDLLSSGVQISLACCGCPYMLRGNATSQIMSLICLCWCCQCWLPCTRFVSPIAGWEPQKLLFLVT